MLKKVLLLLVALVFAHAGAAHAAIMGETTFRGDLWTLEDLGGNLFRVTVDTDGAIPTEYIYAVSVNLGGSSSGGSLNGDTAPGTWLYVDGGSDQGGCNGNGTPAFDCAQWQAASGVNKAFDDGSIYTWTFSITGPGIDLTKDHLKATYWNASGFVDQMSQDVTGRVVPEPASMLLLGTGLAGIAARARRRKSAK